MNKKIRRREEKDRRHQPASILKEISDAVANGLDSVKRRTLLNRAYDLKISDREIVEATIEGIRRPFRLERE